MSKIETMNAGTAVAVDAQPAKGTIGALEGLAGFAEDLNNQNMDAMSDPETLDRIVKQRFGSDVSVQDVAEALDALRDISLVD